MKVRAPSRGRRLVALMEEAWARARRRRALYAAVVGALLLGAAVFTLLGSGGDEDADSQRLPSGAAVPERLEFAHRPYLGVSCRTPNSIACDRVRLAIWLREPATSVSATIAGRDLAVKRPRWTCRPSQRSKFCGTYFQGSLRPAGLIDGPLAVQPVERGHLWFGERPRSAVVEIRARVGGRVAERTLRVHLSTGWG
jgi:hypothetical protein